MFDWLHGRNGLFYFSRSSSARVLGISVFGDYHDTWWHNLTVFPVWRVGTYFNDWLYWFKYRFVRKHQYNRVDTGLEPGYYDYDTRMINACFALLLEYIEEDGGLDSLTARLRDYENELEQEKPPVHGFEYSRRWKSNLETILDLHDWWTVRHPAKKKRVDDLITALYSEPVLSVIDENGSKVITGKRWNDKEQVLYDEMVRLEYEIPKDEEEALVRLMGIRTILWV